jgi:hypothetical protein
VIRFFSITSERSVTTLDGTERYRRAHPADPFRGIDRLVAHEIAALLLEPIAEHGDMWIGPSRFR